MRPTSRSATISRPTTPEQEPSAPRVGRGISALRAGLLVGLIGITGLLLASLTVGFGRDPSLLRSVLIDRRAPALTGPTLDGRVFDLGAVAGKLTVVNFWASWCVECRREHPGFVRVAERYRDQPVALVGVIFQDDPAAARAYMREMGGDWPNVIDPDGRIAVDYGVYGVPETFLIDSDGIIRAKVVGRIEEGTLRAWIDGALAAMTGSSR